MTTDRREARFEPLVDQVGNAPAPTAAPFELAAGAEDITAMRLPLEAQYMSGRPLAFEGTVTDQGTHVPSAVMSCHTNDSARAAPSGVVMSRDGRDGVPEPCAMNGLTGSAYRTDRSGICGVCPEPLATAYSGA